MSEVTFRLARLGEDQAIIDFINANFDMRLPLINGRSCTTTIMQAAAACPSLQWPRMTVST